MDAPLNRQRIESATTGPEQITTLLGRQQLHAVRANVAEYAVAAGMEPSHAAPFARQCVEEAARRVAAKRLATTASLHDEALKVAAERCGIGAANLGNNGAPSCESGAGQDGADGSVGARLVAAITVAPPPATPAECLQHMPAQPLGELPEVIQPVWWRSAARMAWRQLGALVTAYRK